MLRLVTVLQSFLHLLSASRVVELNGFVLPEKPLFLFLRQQHKPTTLAHTLEYIKQMLEEPNVVDRHAQPHMSEVSGTSLQLMVAGGTDIGLITDAHLEIEGPAGDWLLLAVELGSGEFDMGVGNDFVAGENAVVYAFSEVRGGSTCGGGWAGRISTVASFI